MWSYWYYHKFYVGMKQKYSKSNFISEQKSEIYETE
jgi:hypothetical protein